MARGERHQSALSAIALTDEASTVPAENSSPAFTHSQGVVWQLGVDKGEVLVLLDVVEAAGQFDCS